ncbi:MAG: hypothetical protein U0V49_00350 [Saprospiraceae bacterium]
MSHRINICLGVISMLFLGHFSTFELNAQNRDSIIFQPQGRFDFSLLYSGYTPLIDRLGRPYVYLATKELGLVIFDISDRLHPFPVDSITVAQLGNLKATGVSQEGAHLLISLGDFQGAGEKAGLAIFDISNPLQPLLLDQWDSTAFTKGSTSVQIQGDYAYLSAMDEGLLILDISNSKQIRFVSQFVPDINFGNHHNGYHTRGLFLSGDTILIAHDNGGLRIVDIMDKKKPVELGKYVNQAIDTTGIAYYNHVLKIGQFAYCTVDFCGIETIDLSNPSKMKNAAWLNPWNCTSQPPPFGSWNGSDGHCNEIAYSSAHHQIFISGGDSQILALDTKDPYHPKINGTYGPAQDNVGSWGADVNDDLIAIANIHTLGFPFKSTVGGLELIQWTQSTLTDEHAMAHPEIWFYPNPCHDQFFIHSNQSLEGVTLFMINGLGEVVLQKTLNHDATQCIDCHKIPSALYSLLLMKGGIIMTSQRYVIMD